MKFLQTSSIIVITWASLLVVECRAWCSRCPFEWAEYNGQCYRPFLQSLGYEEAEEHCQSQTPNAPGHLLKIDSLDEMVFIMEYIDAILQNVEGDYVWLTEDITVEKANNLTFSSAMGEIEGHNHWITSCTASTPAIDVNFDTGTFKMIDSPDFVDSSCAVYVDSGAYVDLGDFAGTCVSDPDVCTSLKVSWSIWLKLNSTDLTSDEKYYISVGGRTRSARGITLLYQTVSSVVTTPKIKFGIRSFRRNFRGIFGLEPHGQVQMDTWFHFVATVDLTLDSADIVKIYLNGERVIPEFKNIESHSWTNDGYTNLFLGRENPATGQDASTVTTFWSSAAYSSLSVFDGLLSDPEIRDIYACGSIDTDLRIRSLMANKTNTPQDIHRYECRASGITALNMTSPDIISWRVYYRGGYWVSFNSSSVDEDVHVTVSNVSACIVESVLVINTSRWAGSVGDVISCSASFGPSNASASIYQGKNRTIGYADNDNTGFLFTGNGAHFRNYNHPFTGDKQNTKKFPFICEKAPRF